MAFGFNPLKGITRAFGIPDKNRPAIRTALNVIFPVPYLANELAGKGLDFATRALAPKPKNISQLSQPSGFFQQMPSYNVTYGAPTYQGGTTYDPWTYQPVNPYGGSQWDYSTASPIYSIPQYPVYSAPRQDRSWEDLTSLAGAVLPFFL